MESEADNFKMAIGQVTELIFSLSNSIRQLSLSTLDLQALALSKKHQIEKAIDRVDDLGEVVGQLIEFLERIVCFYIRHSNQLDDYQCHCECHGKSD